jgi:hypothetical protein
MSGFPTLRPAAASLSFAVHELRPVLPGMKTGDAISPPGGWKGGGMQMLVDVSIDPAGNVWVSNNWEDPTSCYKPDESVSTRCGGQGMTVFYGMAKPVHAPQIGPARQLQ